MCLLCRVCLIDAKEVASTQMGILPSFQRSEGLQSQLEMGRDLERLPNELHEELRLPGTPDIAEAVVNEPVICSADIEARLDGIVEALSVADKQHPDLVPLCVERCIFVS